MDNKEFDGLSGKDLILKLNKEILHDIGFAARQGGNAMKTVANDIYAEDVHFIKELIQNADDNQYAEEVVPSLTCKFFPNRLEVFCNEIGFNEKQIIAICSLGESTKKDRKTVNIGEKGICFKSVFSISSCPEIHSGDYHFYFDENTPHPEKSGECHPYSLILPHWIEGDGHSYECGTKLVLQYREDKPEKRREFEESVSNNMFGEILLFLRKLKKLRVEGSQGVPDFCHVKEHYSEGDLSYTIINSGNSSDRYMTVQKKLDMSDIE